MATTTTNMWRQVLARAPSRPVSSRNFSRLVNSGDRVTHYNVRIKPGNPLARHVMITSPFALSGAPSPSFHAINVCII